MLLHLCVSKKRAKTEQGQASSEEPWWPSWTTDVCAAVKEGRCEFLPLNTKLFPHLPLQQISQGRYPQGLCENTYALCVAP